MNVAYYFALEDLEMLPRGSCTQLDCDIKFNLTADFHQIFGIWGNNAQAIASFVRWPAERHLTNQRRS